MAAASPSSSETVDPKSDKPDSSSENPNPNPDPTPPQSENPNPDPSNPNPNPTLVTPPPPSFTPSFRPLGFPLMPQYSTIPNPNPSPSIQPPGVSAPVTYGSVTVSAPPMRYPPPNAPPMGYGQVPNGYMAFPPPGIPRYPGPYPTMVRPGFPPRPLPPMGVIPQIPRPPIPGVRGVPPMVTPMVRPVVPAVAATEKPQTTVYVGKIAATVDNEFLLSLLRLCGPVKSWKRAQDPSNGSPKGFGFCEFEAAEGILRALRLLTKLNIDGQELVLNINQTTREYLERYVEKKTEREKLKETESQTLEKDNESAPGVEKQEPSKTVAEETPKDPDDSGDKENQENQRFGIVTNEDREADKDALEMITSMIEERLKTKPLPPPPPVQGSVDTPVKSNSEVPSKSRDGDSDVDILRSAEDDTTSETKPATEHDKPERTSPERGRRHERSSRERDRERDSKRDKERELERYERERERERVRREKERDSKIREAERFYNNRLKEWEAREREQEHQCLKEKEREKDRQRERRREISRDEDGSDDDEEDTRKRRRRRNTLEEKRRKRQREKEEDMADRLKEEEEIAEAKKREIEEQKQIEETKSLPVQVTEESEKVMQVDGMTIDGKETAVMLQNYDGISASDEDTGHVNYSNKIGGEPTVGSAAVPDIKQSNDAPSRKLGFGLVASGKRTNVPSVFLEEDVNVEDKKMKPLVPIDYSTEELQAIQPTVSSTPPNLVAAAEFAKRISGVNPKEEKPEIDRDRNGRPNDKVRHRERDHNDDENSRYRNENKEKIRDRSHEREKNREDKPKSENKKLLDAKQLIDMIPKTKEELFAYEINWAVFDKHELHEKMRPWISKKITEFLGEEEKTLVDYIVSSTKEHVQASNMLELLRAILDDEAEMFVLKMWRMLIFEIKRVETGLSAKPKA